MEDGRVCLLARHIVDFALELQRGDRLLVELHGEGLPLALAVVEESFDRGARPFVHRHDYRLERALLRGADASLLEEITAFEVARMEKMDAYVDIRGTENLYAWSDVPQEKLDLYRSRYFGPLHLQRRCGHTRWSVMRYPNDAMAQQAKMSTKAFEDFYFGACLVDYGRMERAMRPLVDLMERTDRVRVVGPGVDLAFSIKGVGAVALAGRRNLPDGEVYSAPVRGSVEGRVRFNVPFPYEGFVLSDVELVFREGRVVACSCNDGPRLEAILDTDEGARFPGEFALGVNPKILHPMADVLFDEKIAGSFHLTPGNAYANADNGNRSSVHLDFTCIQRPEYGGGEIYFDDRLIRKDGLFVVEALGDLNPDRLS